MARQDAWDITGEAFGGILPGGEVKHGILSGRFSENERSYVIELISAINQYLADRQMVIRRAGGERTINGNGFVKFPDVILFEDEHRSRVLQGWEAKCPDTPIDEANFVEDAHQKAILLGCDSCVLWNFRHAQLHVRKADGTFEIAGDWLISSEIVDRESIRIFEEEWKHFLRFLLNTIAEYVETGVLKHRDLGEAITSSIMPRIINENKAVFAGELRKRALADASIGASIKMWWLSSKKEYTHDEADAFSAYAKNVLVGWLNCLLFANLIKCQYRPARRIEDIALGCSVPQAVDDLNCITEECDFKNVFLLEPYSDLLPDETWDDLVRFNELLQTCNIDELDSEYRHKLLVENVSLAKRQIAGQYPTPEPLANLLCDIGMRNTLGNTWDCCCGTGTIGRAICKKKQRAFSAVFASGEAMCKAFDTTWLSDIHDYPLRVATLSLSSLGMQQKSPLRIFQSNVFDVDEMKSVDFVDPTTGEKNAYSIPKFDSIISNLPFVDFNTKEISWYARVKREEGERVKKAAGISLSERNDLYAYIALRIRPLLSETGIACLLTSNTWLCSEAGISFFNALQIDYAILGVYVNGENRWFESADVMNAILLLEPKNGKAQEEYRFGLIDASIDDLANPELRESIALSILNKRPLCPKHFCEHRYTREQVERLMAIGVSLYSLCFGMGAIYDIRESLVKLDRDFVVYRATKTGMNDAFYSSNPDFVDEKYCFGLVKDLKDTGSYVVQANAFAFDCCDSESYLEEHGYNKTLKHIRRFSGSLTQSVINHSPYWYSLPSNSSFSFATAMNPFERLFFARPRGGATYYADQRLICLTEKSDDVDMDLSFALLNSVVGLLLLEATSGPMALGALDTRAKSVARMSILNTSLVSSSDRSIILKEFEILSRRDILPLRQELYQEDRKRFDRAVLRAFGLEHLHDSLTRILCSLISVRTHRFANDGSDG